MAQHPKIR